MSVKRGRGAGSDSHYGPANPRRVPSPGVLSRGGAWALTYIRKPLRPPPRSRSRPRKTLQNRARGREGERGRGDSWLKLALMPRAPPSADMRNTRSHSMLQRIRDSRNHPPNSDDTGKGLKIKRGRQRKEGQLPMLRESLADLPAAAKTPLHSAPGMGKFPHDDRRQSRQEPVDHSRIG